MRYCTAPILRWVNVPLMAACFLLLHALVTAAERRSLKGTDDTAPAFTPAPASTPTVKGGDVGCGEGTAASVSDSRDVDMAPIAFSLVLCLFPLLWSYSFMHYTDMGSTMTLLTCQLLLSRTRATGTSAEERGGQGVLVGQRGSKGRGEDGWHGRLRRSGWGRGLAAAAAGVVATVFRQTNAVWVTFLWGAALLRCG